MSGDFAEELERLESEGLLRTPFPLEPLSPFSARVGKKEIQVFCSNDYLGLRFHPAVLKAAHQALDQYGVGSCSARQVAGDLPPHRALEQKLADFLGSEASLLFSSGYLANTGPIPCLVGEGDVIFSDEKNHASLIDGCRLSKAKVVIYRHASIEDLESKLRASTARRKLVVTESVFSMDGDLVDLGRLVALRQKYEFLLFLDEAHSIGTLGKTGKGAVEHFRLNPQEIDFRMGTLSKALGSQGAFIAASRESIEYLRNFARSYLFDTSLAPAMAAAALAAVEVLEKDSTFTSRLSEKSKALRVRLSSIFANLQDSFPSPIIPLLVGESANTMEFSRWLLEQGAYIQGIRPPTVAPGTSRLRLTISLGQSDESLHFVADLLEKGSRKFLPVLQKKTL